MDDLLSAAICEAGLEEFLLAPEVVGTELEKSLGTDVASQPVINTNTLAEFSKAVSNDKLNAEILGDGCVILPSCSHADFETNSLSNMPQTGDISNNIAENAPPATVQQNMAEVIETDELLDDMSGDKQTILSQPGKLQDDRNMSPLRRPVTSAQQQLQSSSVMVN